MLVHLLQMQLKIITSLQHMLLCFVCLQFYSCQSFGILSTEQNFLLAQLMREHRIIVLAPVMEKVKQARWEKFHMQLNGLSTNIDSAQTLQCSMGYHL